MCGRMFPTAPSRTPLRSGGRPDGQASESQGRVPAARSARAPAGSEATGRSVAHLAVHVGQKTLPPCPKTPASRAHKRMGVLNRARREHTTVEAAARELGVPMATVRYRLADALEPTKQGRTLPRSADRLTRLRPLLIEGEKGPTRRYAAASEAACHVRGGGGRFRRETAGRKSGDGRSGPTEVLGDARTSGRE